MIFSENALPRVYRSLLKLTQKRGAFTLGRFNHRLFPNGQYFHMASGNRFFVPGDPHFFGYLTGHELHIAQLIDELVRPDEVCFDVGANIGYFTSQMAARCGSEGLVVAFEPDKKNFKWLKKNASLARESGCEIELVQAAVSARPGKRRLIPGAHSTLHKTEVADEDTLYEEVITAVNLDNEVKRLNITQQIHLIKIDVEGHEAAVLQGMEHIVRDGQVRNAIVEISPGESAAAVEKILDSWGGRVRSVRCWNGDAWQLLAPTKLSWRSDALVTFA